MRSILAFDQTLGNTGAVLIHDAGPEHLLHVFRAWTFGRPTDSLKSFEATYSRAETLRDRLTRFMQTEINTPEIEAIVHEMPAVYGYRTESSLIAGYVIRTVVRDLGIKAPVVVVSNQHAKKVLTGTSKANKAEVKAAVRDRMFVAPDVKPWNEHTADAAMLGYTHIMDTRGAVNV
jgi:Holliday junction resolvasome RuvABC endonuclease subunit